MQRITAIDPEAATGKAKDLMEKVRTSLRAIPNLVRTMAASPAVLEAYLGFGQALSKGMLSARLREQIALVVAETNGCAYCLAAHTAIGKKIGLSEDTLIGSRRADSENSKDRAALQFARTVVRTRGEVRDQDIDHLRTLGFTDGEIAEVVANVALNLFTNYFNHVARTEVDFPAAPALSNEPACSC
ncbi:MAG: peroxidase-related enzyme [Nitrospirota bacterium]